MLARRRAALNAVRYGAGAILSVGAAWTLWWLGAEPERVMPETVLPPWGQRSWRIGERCQWQGVTLVCCMNHYAGDKAEHPWDPGDCWAAWKQACLWAPDGDVEAGRLASIVGRAEQLGVAHPERLRAVALLASGHAKAA